jgi:hypothetical protein
MDITQISIVVDDGGKSQAVAISTTSAQSTPIIDETALVTLTTSAFVRKGTNPTAVSTGADIYLMADVTYRLAVARGERLAFITTGGSGTAYITPGG